MVTKKYCSDLALFGGVPSFKTPLCVNEPCVGDRTTFDKFIDRAWCTKRFSNDGPLVQELEEKLADKLGVNNCVLMTNGTIALSVLIKVLGLQGEVILPSFTFISTAHTLMLSGLDPIFCDVRPGDWTIRADNCESLITENTTAIIPTHLWGRPCDVDAFQKIAHQHNIRLIFDAAHAFGCSYNGQTIGSFGDAEVFSLHATKPFHTAEGGMVACNDAELANKLKLARNFGFVEFDQVGGLGTNAKMSELSAAMGLTNLEQYDSSVAKNQAVYQTYRSHLDRVEHVSLIDFDEREDHNYWYICLELSDDCPIARDDIVRILQAENILVRRYFHPGCHRMKPYDKLIPRTEGGLPMTEWIAEHILVLPGGQGVSNDAIRDICQVLEFILGNADAVLVALAGDHFSEAAR